MTKKLIYTAVLLMFCVNLSSAQNNVDFKKKNFKNDIAGFEKAKNHIQNGDIYYKIGTGAYKIAVLFYEKAQEFNPNNDELNLKIGICYLHTDQKDKAKDYILKSIKLQKKKKSYAQYYLGNSLQYESKFEEAINSYNKFLDNMPLYKRKKCKRMALKRISECESGQILLKEKLNIDIHNPGAELNSENSEYLPQLSFAEDTLYFTSRRKSGNTETASIDSGDFLWFEDVYTAIYKDSSYVVKNQGELYNRPFHDALLFKSDKYKIIYRSGKNGDLYLQTKNADGIYSIEKFPETINSKYKESSAVLSPDGNTLYFVSNKTKKSFGGSDIYYSRKDDEGKWEKPVNIGDSINTEYNEDGLYLHPSGKILYFSSQGHNSMGDYDIFISIKNNEGLWSKARNIGYPINSVFNDIHYVISGNGEHAYFASDREGGEGMFDIYKTTTQSNINYLTVLTGIVSDFENNKTLAANVQAFSSDNKLMCNCETDSSGKYQIMVNPGENHTLIVSSTGYMVHSVSFDIPKPIGFDTIRKDIKLMKTKKGNETVLGAVKFKYASSDLTTGSYTSLNKTAAYLKANPEMKVEISGHTDNTGTYEYNKELSENRAKAVVNYLISQNVPEDQMTYKGYAYDKPIASNDTNEGRQKNRRVELKIIE